MYRFPLGGMLIAALIAFGGCSNTDTALTESADGFFSAVADRDMARAHRYLSKPLGSRTSIEALDAFVRFTGLAEAGKRTWQQSSAEDTSGVVSGEIEIQGEPQPLPVRLIFVKEDINWKIDGLARGVRVAGATGERIIYAPADSDSSELARQTTVRFADAVARNDLRGFWSNMAEAFRSQFTADQFNQAFSGFVRDQVNLGAAARLSPRFTTSPTLEANGELVMRGVFPTQPSQTAFEYRYVNEGDRWLNSGISISLVPRG